MLHIEDKIQQALEKGRERKKKLLNGEGSGDTIDLIDEEIRSEITALLQQQSQARVQATDKKDKLDKQ